MKKAIVTFIVLLSAAALQAQSHEADSIVKQFSNDADSMILEFEQYSQNAFDEYMRYEAEMRAEYSRYVSSIKQMWGADSVVNDTRSEWVEYSNDFKSRSIVDFESGEVSVEVVLDDVDGNNEEEVERLLAQAIEKMLESKGNSNPYDSKGKGSALTENPILDGLIDLSRYNIEKSIAAEKPNSKNKRKTPPSPTVRGKNLEFADNSKNVTKANDEEAKRIAEENKKLEEEAERIAEMQKKQEEETNRLAESRKKQEEETRILAEERKRQEEETKKLTEARKRQEEEAKKLAEARKKQEEEAKKLAEARKKQEEEERKLAEVKKKQEEERKLAEARKKQEEEERKLAEARKKQEEEERKLAEARKKQEEEERKLAEAKKKQEEEERKLAEAKKKQQEEEKRLAKTKDEQKASNKDIAQAIAKQSDKSTTVVKGEDNKERTVVKIGMALVSDNLSKNAALYKDIVNTHSEKFEIEEPLIFAVMEQESHFNPEAKSWVPAYGLMQLVPKSGGYDAYRYVHKRDWIPTMEYLYVPQQNIELGTAYLRILENMFKNVKDADCRRLCVIAGYNTGAGNVCRAFTGKTNIKGAVEYINKYSYEELYDYLTKNLSTDEARKYVSGVSSKREKYIKK